MAGQAHMGFKVPNVDNYANWRQQTMVDAQHSSAWSKADMLQYEAWQER